MLFGERFVYAKHFIFEIFNYNNDSHENSMSNKKIIINAFFSGVITKYDNFDNYTFSCDTTVTIIVFVSADSSRLLNGIILFAIK